MEDGGYPNVCLQLSGNSVVFDSFSSKEAVSKLNTTINNVSGARYSSRRFPTKFSVEVEGKVSAILSEASVDSYMIVNKQNQTIIKANTRLSKKHATPASQENTATVTMNLSSSSEGIPLPPPPQRKRQLEATPAMPIQAPPRRFASVQIYPHLGGFIQQQFQAAPRIILTKSTYTRPDTKPLFAPSDDDDEQPSPPASTSIFSLGTMQPGAGLSSNQFIQIAGRMNAPAAPRIKVLLEKPTYTSPNMRPLFAPSDDDWQQQPSSKGPTASPPTKISTVFEGTMQPGAPMSSNDFAGPTQCNLIISTSVVSMPNMDPSRMSGQKEIDLLPSRLFAASRESKGCSIRIGTKVRVASQEELIAIHALTQMGSPN